MTNPCHAPYYADELQHQTVAILLNQRLAKDTYKIRIRSSEIAQRIRPGQFLMVRISGANDPLLGRAFALYDVVLHGDSTAADCVEFVYLVGGKMTSAMAKMQPGQQLDIWGPLGNGFPELDVEHLILVAGGIGQTPFLATGKSYLGKQAYGLYVSETSNANRVTLCYGARTADYLAGVDDFRWAGMDVRISTDDGSHGHHGLVTETLRQVLSETSADSRAIFCCGPEPMMHAVANVAEAENVRCFVSLEAPMACGIGICFTCVTKVKMPDGTWDFKRTCVEGPIFDAEKLEWE